MILVSSSNKNMNMVIGENLTQRRLPNGRTEFFNEEFSFDSTVKHYYLNGATYIVITEHSVYEFQLLQGENIVCGEYFSHPINGLWEMERTQTV